LIKHGLRTRCPPQANKHAEEKAADEAARAKEAEEQAALPYKWTQTIGDLDITTEIPGNLKAKDLIVDIKKTKLVVGIKGQEPILSVSKSITAYPMLSSFALGFLFANLLHQLGRSPPRHPCR
jgi:hypothetical protein